MSARKGLPDYPQTSGMIQPIYSREPHRSRRSTYTLTYKMVRAGLAVIIIAAGVQFRCLGCLHFFVRGKETEAKPLLVIHGLAAFEHPCPSARALRPFSQVLYFFIARGQALNGCPVAYPVQGQIPNCAWIPINCLLIWTLAEIVCSRSARP